MSCVMRRRVGSALRSATAINGARRFYSTAESPERKAAVLGQPLALSKIALHDITGATTRSHLNFRAEISLLLRYAKHVSPITFRNMATDTAKAEESAQVPVAEKPTKDGDKADASDRTNSSGRPVRGGPVSWMSLLLLIITGAGLIVYFDREKKLRVLSNPANGERAQCKPEEERYTQRNQQKAGLEVVPIFISVDPERDTVEQVREYVKGILLRKTGGLVIWRSGGSIVLYRGMTYEYPSVKAAKHEHENNKVPALQFGGGMQSTAERDCKPVNGVYESNSIDTSDRDELADMVDVETVSDSHLGTDDFDGTESVRPPVEADYESEINKILDGLGPRFTDWSGRDPLPVDADLLPGVVPGYKEPFRLLPYGMRPKLSNREMTNLRRLARTIPPHFALGRNRHHEGLATAMVKLWERSAIAKIALKRGVQNTNNERMAEELKSGDEEAYLEPHDSYSENEDISSELQSERGETENIEMEEENSAHSRIFGMNFEDYSAGSREVKEDDPDQFVHPLMDIQDNSTEISELEDKDVLYAQSRTAVEGHDTSNSTEAIVDKETVP